MMGDAEKATAEAIRLYNMGYHAGHEDTVEASYVDIVAADMDTYHGDVVAEIIEEGLTS